MPLTDVSVRNTKPQAKPIKAFDEKGLYLLVQPAGGKLWRMDYRFDGKRKTMALGAYPAVKLAEARQARDEARSLLAKGIDPSAARKAERAAKEAVKRHQFEAVAREWFALKSPEWAESHSGKIIARLENDVFPWIGSKSVGEITTPELLAVLLRISHRGAKDTAKRAQHDCGAIFRFAAQRGYTMNNPAAPLRGALPIPQEGHFAALTEPEQVGELLRSFDAFRGSFPVACALRIAPYLFVRPGELRQAKWVDIDLDRAEWNFIVSKQRKTEVQRVHLVPLSAHVVAILRELHALTGGGDYVFPGARDRNRPMSEATINAALRRLGWDTRTQITAHGFRAMARTILHERLGVKVEVIEHQLAHKVPDALGSAYNRTKFLIERKAMMQRWADYLGELKAGGGADVVKLDSVRAA